MIGRGAPMGHSAAAPYASVVIDQAPRLLSMLDREPDSKTYGSFDRDHWAWKFRDFPITMLQASVVPLALLWRHPFPDNRYTDNPRLLGWICAALDDICHRQKKNGAFDSVGPFTYDHGVTLAMVGVLTETLAVIAPHAPAVLVGRVKQTVSAACEFASRSSEDYAFISNHQALFALAYLNAHSFLGDEAYRRRADEVISAILAQQSRDGWYREYEGPDPGYETLGISYLAKYWQRTGSERLLDSLRRSVDFLAHCIHPDGSIGGVYGSRHTAIYYPAGLEILAPHLPMALGIARFMLGQIHGGRAITPSVVDAENLPPLSSNYLDAALAHQPGLESPQPLPGHALNQIRDFADAEITVAGSPHYYAVVNHRKGGVCRVFDRQSGRLAYEDAGYLIRANGRLWTSQLLGAGCSSGATEPNTRACSTRFAQVRQEVLTPARFILLRLLNLTVFRSLRLGIWVRRQVIRLLITAKKPGPLRLRRAIVFHDKEIAFEDRLDAKPGTRVGSVDLARAFTGVHMGSARYFQGSELDSTLEPETTGLARDLNRERTARLDFRLHFSKTTGPELVIPSANAGTESPAPQPLIRS